ncbi:MAG: hypothetical protein ISS28_05480 [Candidatus Cloacimonetes bacterium]|nr:hypothetical protein [Candidatus Cloacimonadota bacterium]MBL7086531.1 hypothetical protein [Candidatus Cloacimonadota bacterium]
MKILKISFVVLIVSYLMGCKVFYLKNNLSDFKKGNSLQYQASISSDFDDGNKLALHMYYAFPKASSYSGHEFMFNANNYGKYWTFNPYIKNPVMLLPMFSQGVGGSISLPKLDEYQFIFFVDGEKEEFEISVKDNVVKVTPVKSKHIIFDPAIVNLLPENTITISYSNELSDPLLNIDLHRNLVELGCIPKKLPSGNYYKFELIGYYKLDEYAHLDRNKLRLFYFFEVNKNYARVDSLLRSYYKIFSDKKIKYRYDYNFNKNEKIEDEKNLGLKIVNLQEPGFPKELQFQEFYTKEITGISFNLDKPQKVKIGIFDVKGNNIKNIEMVCSSSGSFTYSWDGILDDGKKAPKGVYFYKLEIDNIQKKIKKLLLLE